MTIHSCAIKMFFSEIRGWTIYCYGVGAINNMERDVATFLQKNCFRILIWNQLIACCWWWWIVWREISHRATGGRQFPDNFRQLCDDWNAAIRMVFTSKWSKYFYCLQTPAFAFNYVYGSWQECSLHYSFPDQLVHHHLH